MCFVFFASKLYANSTVLMIEAPEGFNRVSSSSDSYLAYLRSLPLKSENTITVWNGDSLPKGIYDLLAVVDLPLLFDEDLEQCADFSMRLWAEYLNNIGALERLHLYDFNGRKRAFSDSGKTFKRYLHWHMTHSNSYSIRRGAKKVRLLSELRAGDMFVQNDSEESIGHVSVVVDEAVNSFGHKLYLVGYSFMPAQQFHIERAGDEYGIAGWFTADGYTQYAKHWFGAFGEPIIMRFE